MRSLARAEPGLAAPARSTRRLTALLQSPAAAAERVAIATIVDRDEARLRLDREVTEDFLFQLRSGRASTHRDCLPCHEMERAGIVGLRTGGRPLQSDFSSSARVHYGSDEMT